jgi:hypothetical protein
MSKLQEAAKPTWFVCASADAELDELLDYAYFTREIDKSFARMGLIEA